MTDATHDPDRPCGSGCTRCGLHAAPPDVPVLRGWRLTVSALGVFLLPLVLAVAGAVVVGGEGGRQFLGALAGLAVGLAGGVLIGRCVSRSAKGAA